MSADALRLSPAESALVEAVRGLRFGAVTAVVHDGRVVRLERSEKIRFEGDPAAGALAGDETTFRDWPRPERRSPPEDTEEHRR